MTRARAVLAVALGVAVCAIAGGAVWAKTYDPLEAGGLGGGGDVKHGGRSTDSAFVADGAPSVWLQPFRPGASA